MKNLNFGDRITVDGKHGTFQRYGEGSQCIVEFDGGDGISFADENSITVTFRSFDGHHEKLVGKYVLWTHGMSYSQKDSISKITKVTKTSFKIGDEPTLFDFTGSGRGVGSSRMDMGSVSRCEIISDDEAKEISAKWRLNSEINKMKDDVRKSIDTLTHEQLTAIMNIINSK